MTFRGLLQTPTFIGIGIGVLLTVGGFLAFKSVPRSTLNCRNVTIKLPNVPTAEDYICAGQNVTWQASSPLTITLSLIHI